MHFCFMTNILRCHTRADTSHSSISEHIAHNILGTRCGGPQIHYIKELDGKDGNLCCSRGKWAWIGIKTALS